MKIEILLLCDAATESAGKLNILGAFDTIISKSLPVVHPLFSIVVRLRGNSKDIGNHKIAISATNDLGDPLFPKFDGSFTYDGPQADPSSTINFLLNFQNIKVEKYDMYDVKVRIDEDITASTPIFIKPAPDSISVVL